MGRDPTTSGMSPESAERVMLEIVAYRDPIDYHALRSAVGERLNGEYSSERHRTALDNLKELGLVCRGGLGHEYVHLTDEGWGHLGGETPRHHMDVDEVEATECAVCAADDLATDRW